MQIKAPSISFILVSFVLLAALLVWLWPESITPPETPYSTSRQAVEHLDTGDLTSDKGSEDELSKQASDTGDLMAQVNSDIAASERAQHKVNAFLESRGWKVVDASVPDAELAELHPRLVDQGRKSELMAQLRSNSLHEHLIDNAVDIARRTTSESLRREVVSALSRLKSERSLHALIELYTSGESADGQGQTWLENDFILTQIRPFSLESDAADWLVLTFNEGTGNTESQNKVAVNLVMASIRDQIANDQPNNLIEKVDPAWHPMLYEIFEQFQGDS